MNPAVVLSAAERAPRPSRAWLLGWLFLLMGACRLLQVLSHEPMAGYANQYDMIRAHACLGWWPDLPAEQRSAAHAQAPVAGYVRGAVDAGNCHASTDVWLAHAAFALASVMQPDAATLDLRWIGAFKAMLLLGLATWLQWRLRSRPTLAAGHAAVFAVLLCDPLNTLFLNSLYTEFGALLGAYASAMAILLLRPRRGRAGSAAVVLLALGVLALACSRLQHVPIAVLLALLGVFRARLRAPQRTVLVVLLLAALGCGWLNQQAAQQRLAAVPLANRANALFGAVLPAAAEPLSLLRRLGLPEACDDLRYANWYVNRGRDLYAHCPQALQPGLGRIGMALLGQPRTAVVALARGLGAMGPWRLNYVGEMADAQYGRLPAGALGLGASLGDLQSGRGFAFQALFWSGAVLLAMAAALAALRRRPQGVRTSAARRADALATLLPILGAVVVLGWCASVFGDGYSELARHLHLAINAALLCWLLALPWLFTQLRQARLLPTVLWIVSTAVCGWAILRLPLAMGRITAPAVDQVSAGTQPVSGWILADGTPQSAELCIDQACTPLTLDHDPATSWYFALQDASAGWRFSTSADLHAGQVLELWLTDAHGLRQQVERRVLIDP